MTEKSKLLLRRQPTEEEKSQGAEIVFLRIGADGREHAILACSSEHSFEQWGAERPILSDNVADADKWRWEHEENRERYRAECCVDCDKPNAECTCLEDEPSDPHADLAGETVRALKNRLADLRAAFEEAGGRGVEMADEIDAIEAELARRQERREKVGPKKSGETKVIRVQLGALTRVIKTVDVEVPADFDEWPEFRRQAALGTVFDADVEGDGYEPDNEWGMDEGTHAAIGPSKMGTLPEFAIDKDGNAVDLYPPSPVKS